MKPENWTDYEHPCFEDYNPDPMSMTKEQFIEEAECIDDCDCYRNNDCDWKERGHDWHNCRSGRLSKWQDWLPTGPADMPEKMSPDEIPLWTKEAMNG